jgi:hypothetical protein
MSEKPPVPWDEVPKGARYVTIDVWGCVYAWSRAKPRIGVYGVWLGPRAKMMRSGLAGKHSPQIWKRPA